MLLPHFLPERCCSLPGPDQISVTPMVDELLFPVQMTPWNMLELKVGVYIGAGVREGGREVKVGVLLKRDMMSVRKAGVAAGVFVGRGVVVADEAVGV